MTTLNALLEAIKARDLDAVTALLDAERDLANRHPDVGPTPVLLAAYLGAEEIVALLRARGAVLDVFEAAAVGDTARLGALVAAAGLVNAYSSEGWTPLHLACFLGQAEAAGLLLDHGADVGAVSTDTTMRNTPLHAAIAGKRDHALIGRLLERGADVNAAGGGGVTPLHLAAARGDVPLIDLLLAHGARPTETDDGQTPLDLATERGHPAAADRLR
jgi:ankyrin repeat protein